MKLYTTNNDGIHGTIGTVYSHIPVHTEDLPAERSASFVETTLPKNVTQCDEYGHGWVFTAQVKSPQPGNPAMIEVPVQAQIAPNDAVIRWVLQWDGGKSPEQLCVTKCTSPQESTKEA
jgi:hypothetical protein